MYRSSWKVAYWNRYWGYKSKQSEWIHERWKQNFLKKVLDRGKLILDVGCGNGITSAEISNHNRVIGVDLSESALIEASKRNIKVVLCDVNETLPFVNSCIDWVLILDVLEHILFPEKLIEECKRVVRKNGLLIISVPNTLNIINRIFFLLGAAKDITDVNHLHGELFSEHIHPFSRNILDKLIKKTGLRYITSEYFFSKRVTHKSWKKFSFITTVIYYLRLYKLFPSLFSYSFIVVCRKGID